MVQVIGMALWETVGLVIGKIAWKSVSERFLVRLIIWSLKKLRDKSTNEVVDDTINDIIKSLEDKKVDIAK